MKCVIECRCDRATRAARKLSFESPRHESGGFVCAARPLILLHISKLVSSYLALLAFLFFALGRGPSPLANILPGLSVSNVHLT